MFYQGNKKEYGGTIKQIAFIVGTGRCGTTILAQVLNSHSRICIPHELQIIVSIGNGERLYEKYTSGKIKDFKAQDYIQLIESRCPYHFQEYFDFHRHFNELSYPQTDLQEILKDLFDDICYTFKKEVFFEQTPWYGQRLDVLKQIFPEMKVVHIVRDARDVAISFSRTPWWSKDINANLIQWEKEVNVIRSFGMENPDIYIEIRYEDLVLYPENELQKVVKMLGLKFEEGMLDPDNLIDYTKYSKSDIGGISSNKFNEWKENRKKIFFKNSIYAWKNDPLRKTFIMNKKIQDTLQYYNYDI